MRITSFDDKQSFQRVLDLLTGLYPERDPRAFQAALARLPCMLSHDAAEPAARRLEQALSDRGAGVLLMPHSMPTASGRQAALRVQEDTSPEIDLSFLRAARSEAQDEPGQKRTPPRPPRSRARRRTKSEPRDVPGTGSKPPWES